MTNEQKDELKRQAIELVKSGVSYSQVGKKLGVSKTTISNWIKALPDSERKMNVHLDEMDKLNDMDDLEEVMNDLGDLYSDLRKDYGKSNIEVVALLRKAEMENDFKLEELDLQRIKEDQKDEIAQKEKNVARLKERLSEIETKLNQARQKLTQNELDSSDLNEKLATAEQKNEELINIINELDEIKEEIPELDENIKEEYNDIVLEFLDLEDNECTFEDIDELSENTKIVTKSIGKWYKKQNLDKSTSEERSVLKNIIASLDEILLEFEESDEEELEITFNSDFELGLKSEYS